MKIAIIYNRDSQAVVNLLGLPNREKYVLKTIRLIKRALEAGGHQVETFEGDKNIIYKLEEFMPAVISGERPGLVFNLSYGIQGRARYTHIPAILEMLGIPYVGSGPQTHAIALDKVLTKIILIQKGLPTPRFAVLDDPGASLTEKLKYPLILKPKDEAVSLGLRVVHNPAELTAGARMIHETFQSAVLVEEYIQGRELNVSLLGNDPVIPLPPVEIVFTAGQQIYTYEDKINTSGRAVEKLCPAPLSPAEAGALQDLAVQAFKALGCFDSARIDFRLDGKGRPYILEVNSMPSLAPDGSFVQAAATAGLDYSALVNRLIEIADRRYFGPVALEQPASACNRQAVFTFLTQTRDRMEDELREWTNLTSWTDDPVGLGSAVARFAQQIELLELHPVEKYTNGRFAWTWQTAGGLERGTLLVAPVDVPREKGGGFPIPFRREPEHLYGEGIASSRAGIVCALQALAALQSVRLLEQKRIGVFLYCDEGRGMRYSSPLLHQAALAASTVIVLQPGSRGGKVFDQRRGARKLSLLVEGDPQRIGHHGPHRDVLSWFLAKASRVDGLSRPDQKLTVAVQEINSERFSILLPHRVRATVCITYIDAKLADEAEESIRALFRSEDTGLRAGVEKLEERPSLVRSAASRPVLQKLDSISAEWKIPLGVDSSLLPSAAGFIPPGIPVICGFSPASLNLYTPYEGIYRSELVQRALLLALYLIEE